jgi:putative phosphotransacetylase
MDTQTIKTIVNEVVKQFMKEDSKNLFIPIAVSARHCHLSQADLEQLFGKGYELSKKAELSQPGQFASKETVTLVGPRGCIEKVRILGPVRSATQVEISKTDSVKLGVQPPLRESGNIKDSASITLVGPQGSIYKKDGVIIAQSHIHMSPEDADRFEVVNGEYVRVKNEGIRTMTFENVLVRVSSKYNLEMHIDTDEANAGFISCGDKGLLLNRR